MMPAAGGRCQPPNCAGIGGNSSGHGGGRPGQARNSTCRNRFCNGVWTKNTANRLQLPLSMPPTTLFFRLTTKRRQKTTLSAQFPRLAAEITQGEVGVRALFLPTPPARGRRFRVMLRARRVPRRNPTEDFPMPTDENRRLDRETLRNSAHLVIPEGRGIRSGSDYIPHLSGISRIER